MSNDIFHPSATPDTLSAWQHVAPEIQKAAKEVIKHSEGLYIHSVGSWDDRGRAGGDKVAVLTDKHGLIAMEITMVFRTQGPDHYRYVIKTPFTRRERTDYTLPSGWGAYARASAKLSTVIKAVKQDWGIDSKKKFSGDLLEEETFKSFKDRSRPTLRFLVQRINQKSSIPSVVNTDRDFEKSMLEYIVNGVPLSIEATTHASELLLNSVRQEQEYQKQLANQVPLEGRYKLTTEIKCPTGNIFITGIATVDRVDGDFMTPQATLSDITISKELDEDTKIDLLMHMEAKNMATDSGFTIPRSDTVVEELVSATYYNGSGRNHDIDRFFIKKL
jgi:hypothetical protein